MSISKILHARRNLLELAQAPPQEFDFTSGLVAHYRLNELANETTTAIDSYGTHNAINRGTTTGVSGKFGNAHTFINENTYLEIPNHSDFQFGNQPFSIRFFFKLDTNKNTIFVDKTSSADNREFYFYYVSSGGYLRFRIFKFSGSTDYLNIDLPFSFLVDTWFEVVGTWDGTTNASGIDLYINGVSGGTKSKTGNFTGITAGNRPVFIGRHSNVGFYVSGQMDEIYFWKNRRISAAEASQLHNSNNPIIR